MKVKVPILITDNSEPAEMRPVEDIINMFSHRFWEEEKRKQDFQLDEIAIHPILIRSAIYKYSKQHPDRFIKPLKPHAVTFFVVPYTGPFSTEAKIKNNFFNLLIVYVDKIPNTSGDATQYQTLAGEYKATLQAFYMGRNLSDMKKLRETKKELRSKFPYGKHIPPFMYVKNMGVFHIEHITYLIELVKVLNASFFLQTIISDPMVLPSTTIDSIFGHKIEDFVNNLPGFEHKKQKLLLANTLSDIRLNREAISRVSSAMLYLNSILGTEEQIRQLNSIETEILSMGEYEDKEASFYTYDNTELGSMATIPISSAPEAPTMKPIRRSRITMGTQKPSKKRGQRFRLSQFSKKKPVKPKTEKSKKKKDSSSDSDSSDSSISSSSS
jgi:hypothetical protein